MPPANVQLPTVPLTDTELIVFFFNCLIKPNVALRLYARGWGPASIVAALNKHRVVKPPYLRNTCSVKCTTAIKNGRKNYGDGWESEYRAALADAEDDRATDLIRADGHAGLDYYVRALGIHLREYPSDRDAGIFTKCVQYCVEHQAPYTMSNVYTLAVDLQNNTVPQHPASPAPSAVVTPPKVEPRADEGEETEVDWSEDEHAVSPTPLTKRKPAQHDFGGPLGFVTVNSPMEKTVKCTSEMK